MVEESGERLWEAELYRLTGELLLHQTVPDAQHAEACFCQALATARRQQAKSLESAGGDEPGAVVAASGQACGNCRMLAEVYGWFSEGLIPPTCGRPDIVRRT